MRHGSESSIAANSRSWTHCRLLCPGLFCTYCLCLFLITACVPKLAPADLPLEEVSEFSFTGREVLPVEWWTSFEDSLLNKIVNRALASNLDLAATWQRVEASRALVRRESSLLWPQLEASVGGEINRPEDNLGQTEQFQTSLAASYELDLWGRIRAGVQAEKFHARATYYDYQTTALALSAEITGNYYQLLTAHHQLALARQQLKVNEDILILIRSRFTGGQVRAVDILRQEQLLESTRSQVLHYEMQVLLLQNRLAVLLGLPPQNDLQGLDFLPDLFASEEDLPQLPQLPPLPQTGLPLELIRRRPDVQQAYQLLMAADREMAAAIANTFPRLSLHTSASSFSDKASGLFRDWAYSLGGNLAAPLFYGGRLKAEVEISEAVKYQRLYDYGQSALNAFREVEDALLQEEKLTEQLQLLRQQLDLAQKTNGQLQREYLNGMSEYLEVLLSLNQQQQLQRDLLDARLNQLEIRISLYRALAGNLNEREVEKL